MKRNNNISKPIYDEMKVDEAVKLAMSETPQEEFELELLQTLSQYDKWKDDNSHLTQLQPGKVLLENFKKSRDRMNNQNLQGSQGLNAGQEARLQRLEQKMDKLMKHLGVK